MFVFSNILRCVDNNTFQWSVGMQGRHITYIPVNITAKESVDIQGLNMAYMPVDFTLKASVHKQQNPWHICM